MRHWRDDKGKRWYKSEHRRVTRLFRAHVNRPGNSRGRILRMLCQWCKPNEQITLSQFHHLDYKRPFLGVWCCESHHRKIEAGSVVVTARYVCDYTALVAPVLKPGLSVAMRASHERKSRGQAAPF